VSATIRRSDGVRVRALSDAQPAPGAQQVVPSLEDAYLMFVAPTKDEASPKAA
jgi:hypothetical protein